MTGGASAQTLARIGPLFADSGLVPMQAGNGTGSLSGEADPQIEPGSVLAVPLLTGDMETDRRRHLPPKTNWHADLWLRSFFQTMKGLSNCRSARDRLPRSSPNVRNKF